jgi:tetratricopeptide (TPR) repeat protein
MKKKEIVDIYFEGEDVHAADELDLLSKASSIVDGMPDEVVTAFKFVLIEKLQKLADTYLKQRSNEDVERINGLLIEVSNGRYDIMHNAAYDKMMADDFEEAEPMFEAAFKSEFKKNTFNKNMINTFDNYMVCLANLGKHDKEIAICSEVLSKIDRKSIKPGVNKEMKMLALVNMGEALIKQMEYQKALGVFMQGYLLDPSDVNLKLGLARYYDAVDDYEHVIKLCKEVLEKYPKNDTAWALLGMAHIFSKEREEGARCLMEAYKIDPDNKYTQGNLLSCLGELGKIPVPTNCDEWDYFDELVESGEAHKIINKEMEEDKVLLMRMRLEKMFFSDGTQECFVEAEDNRKSPLLSSNDPLIIGAQAELDRMKKATGNLLEKENAKNKNNREATDRTARKITEDCVLELLANDHIQIFPEEKRQVAIDTMTNLAWQGYIASLDLGDFMLFLRDSGANIIGVSDIFCDENRVELAVEDAIAKIEMNRAIKKDRPFMLDVQGDENLTLYDVNNAMEAAFARLGFNCEALINGHVCNDIKDGVRIVMVI